MDSADENQLNTWKLWKNRPIGTAIYPALALLNHSCDPNIIKYFRGPTVVAVASRAILAGMIFEFRYKFILKIYQIFQVKKFAKIITHFTLKLKH